MSGRASTDLHALIKTVVVAWEDEARINSLKLPGKPLEMLETT